VPTESVRELTELVVACVATRMPVRSVSDERLLVVTAPVKTLMEERVLAVSCVTLRIPTLAVSDEMLLNVPCVAVKTPM